MATRLDWQSDGSLVQPQREGGKSALLKVDPATWTKTSLLAADALQAALVTAGAPVEAAKTALSSGMFIWNEPRTAFLVKVDGVHYLLDLAT